ncbi:MAG: hypothetical protein GY940_28670, partial [bacterium]|nr:hypothetical protein [bacterium]
RLMVLPGTGYRRRAEEFKVVYEPRPYYHLISHYTMSPGEVNRAERMAQAVTFFYNMQTTRDVMFRMAAENNETVIDFADALGVFIDNFNLLDRHELRKGAIIKEGEEAHHLEILKDFKRFRKELADTA